MSSRIWIAAGLYAEGSSDYDFLGELLPRVIADVAHERLGPDFEMREPILKLDAPAPNRGDAPRNRRERIVAAVERTLDECNLILIQADANGDAERARAERVVPAIEELSRRRPELAAVACIPERETEAWVLADSMAFAAIFRRDVSAAVPADPDRLADPKAALRDVVEAANVRGKAPQAFLRVLGRLVNPKTLRRLPAFERFRADLAAALEKLDPRD